MEKKNSRFLNNSQFSLERGCLRGAQFLVNNLLNYKKTCSGPDMTYTHKGTAFNISEIIFNMRIFAIEVIRTGKIV